LIVGVVRDGGFVTGPFVEIIGRCFVKGFAFLVRDPTVCIKRGFLISGQAQSPFLVEPLAGLSERLSVGPNFP